MRYIVFTNDNAKNRQTCTKHAILKLTVAHVSVDLSLAVSTRRSQAKAINCLDKVFILCQLDGMAYVLCHAGSSICLTFPFSIQHGYDEWLLENAMFQLILTFLLSTEVRGSSHMRRSTRPAYVHDGRFGLDKRQLWI